MIVIDNFFSKIKRIFDSKFISCKWWQNRVQYLTIKYVGVFIADKIGRNLGALLTTVLLTLGLPYKKPGVVPTGLILSNSFSEIFSSFLSS